jgi:hypothetical protein
MPASPNIVDSSKHSKGEDGLTLPKALQKIGSYLRIDDGHGRRNDIQKLFFFALESEGLDDVHQRAQMLMYYQALVELDQALEAIYGNGCGLI